jgi:predicted nucleic-acid-binding Zn-ribbon protein
MTLMPSQKLKIAKICLFLVFVSSVWILPQIFGIVDKVDPSEYGVGIIMIPGIVAILGLFLFKCEKCNYTYFYHPKMFLSQIAPKWMPNVFWFVSDSCNHCGYDRVNNGQA